MTKLFVNDLQSEKKDKILQTNIEKFTNIFSLQEIWQSLKAMDTFEPFFIALHVLFCLHSIR